MFAAWQRWSLRIIIACGLVAMLGIAPYLGWHAWKESSWPAVSGRMKSVSIEKRLMPRSWNPIRFDVRVDYEYEVAGQKWSSQRWSWTDERTFTDLEEAEREALLLAPGTTVTAHYDPESPADAVLARESIQSAWLALAAGAWFVIWGTVLSRARAAARSPS